MSSSHGSNIYNKDNPYNYARKIVTNGTVVSVGIIDILQRYNMLKRMENKYKMLISDGKFISCIDSYQYQQRFISFINSIILSVYNHNE